MKLPRTRARARVEMLPLLDIIFLILVFFIYAMLTMSADKAIPLNLPSSNSAKPLHRDALSLSIAADGSLYLDKLPINSRNLVDNLRILVSADKENLSVKVFADAGLSYQKLYRVLDLLREAGVNSIFLQAGSGQGDENDFDRDKDGK